MRAPRRALVCALVAGLLAGACTRSGGPGPNPGPSAAPPRVDGRVLSSDIQNQALFFQPMPAGDPIPLRMPQAFDFVPEAVAVGGSAFAVVWSGDRGGLYRLTPDSPPKSLLPGLRDPGPLVTAAGLVGLPDCADRVLHVFHGDGRPAGNVAAGCISALSPNGRSAAYATPDGTIWSRSVSGADEPVRLFTVAGIRAVEAALGRAHRIAALAWGRPGIAVEVATDDASVVVVATRTGTRAIPSVGPNAASYLAWQPGGRLLAIATGQTGGEGLLRLYDPDHGVLRTIGVRPRGYLGAVWSPDGDAFATLSGAGFFGQGARGFWDLVGVDGRPFGRTRTGGQPLGWVR